MRLTGKAAIVTGAGRGIGRAIALALAREGCAVTLASRTRVELEAVADEVVGLGARSLPFTADVSAEAEAARLVEETLRAFGRVDILVNNAGVSIPFRDVVDLPLVDWERILRVNLTGAFLCARAPTRGCWTRLD